MLKTDDLAGIELDLQIAKVFDLTYDHHIIDHGRTGVSSEYVVLYDINNRLRKWTSPSVEPQEAFRLALCMSKERNWHFFFFYDSPNDNYVVSFECANKNEILYEYAGDDLGEAICKALLYIALAQNEQGEQR